MSVIKTLNQWAPGTYLIYQRGVEFYPKSPRELELPPLLQPGPGGLPYYIDEATDEVVPVIVVRSGQECWLLNDGPEAE